MFLNEIKRVLLVETGRSPVKDTLANLGVQFRPEISKAASKDVPKTFGGMVDRYVMEMNSHPSETDIKKEFKSKEELLSALESADITLQNVNSMETEFSKGLTKIPGLEAVSSAEGHSDIDAWIKKINNILNAAGTTGKPTDNEIVKNQRAYIETNAFSRHPEKIQSAIMRVASGRAWIAASLEFIAEALKSPSPAKNEDVKNRVEAMFALFHILKTNIKMLRSLIASAAGQPKEIEKPGSTPAPTSAP